MSIIAGACIVLLLAGCGGEPGETGATDKSLASVASPTCEQARILGLRNTETAVRETYRMDAKRVVTLQTGKPREKTARVGCIFSCTDTAREIVVEVKGSSNDKVLRKPFVCGPDRQVSQIINLRELVPGKEYSYRCTVIDADGTEHSATDTITTLLAQPPEAQTKPGTLLGTRGVSFNGRVRASNTPTRYWFEYRTKPDGKIRTTPARFVGPGRSAVVQGNYGTDAKWLWHRTPPQLLGREEIFARYPLQGLVSKNYDPNHLDGVGEIALVNAVEIGRPGNSGIPSLNLANGAVDLRDAELTVRLRGDDYEPAGSTLVYWVGTNTKRDLVPDDEIPWTATNWALTSQPLLNASVAGWQDAVFSFPNDTRFWSYAGHNKAQDKHARFLYLPLDSALQGNVANMHLLNLFNAKRATVAGNLDLAEFRLAYRNHSLVGASGPFEMVNGPIGMGSPEAICDGRVGGSLENGWISQKDEGTRSIFIFESETPVNVHSFRAVQHPVWPTKSLYVVLTDVREKLWEIRLDNLPVPVGVNDIKVRSWTLDAPIPDVKKIQLEILGGYKTSFKGLSEFEVFGGRQAEPLFTPDMGVASVTADAVGLSPGDVVSYRLVAENAKGRAAGEVLELAVPRDTRPVVSQLSIHPYGEKMLRFSGRLNPMGNDTSFVVLCAAAPGAEYKPVTYELRAGILDTPRHVFADTLKSMVPSGSVCILGARNKAGVAQSPPMTVP